MQTRRNQIVGMAALILFALCSHSALAWNDAAGVQKVQRVIADLLQRHEGKQLTRDPRLLAEKSWSLYQPELNAYLNHSIRSKKRFGVKSVQVALRERDYVVATVVVDFNQVKIQDDSLFFKTAKSMFSGEQSMTVEGYVRTNSAGKGSFVLEKAYFGSLRIPAFLVNKVIQMVGQRQAPPIDPAQPTALPYGIQKIEIYNGMLKVKS